MKEHILVVEDDHTLNDAFRTILTKEKYKVSSCFNGQEALDFLSDKKNKSVDLILLDLLMPVMSGIEFLEKYDVKENDVPTIVFSNLDSQKDIDRVYELGADRYMLKAWASPKELVKVVQDSLKASK